MSDYDYLFKCLMVGDSGIGKSAIVLRFADDKYSDTFISTIGVDFKIRTFNINDKIVKLQIWDTAGQERFRTITTSYYRGAHVIFICYDITDEDSFSNLKMWYDEIINHASSNVKIVICGTKIDLEAKRVISTARAQAFCDSYGFAYFETSAKNNLNIDTIFTEASQQLIAKMNMIENPIGTAKYHLPADLKATVPKTGCCY